jgi:hypothetical protein
MACATRGEAAAEVAERGEAVGTWTSSKVQRLKSFTSPPGAGSTAAIVAGQGLGGVVVAAAAAAGGVWKP